MPYKVKGRNLFVIPQNNFLYCVSHISATDVPCIAQNDIAHQEIGYNTKNEGINFLLDGKSRKEQKKDDFQDTINKGKDSETAQYPYFDIVKENKLNLLEVYVRVYK